MPSVETLLFDLGDAIPGGLIDGAVVATPTGTHIEVIRDLVSMNPEIHIHCEKPIALCSKEAEEAFAMAPNLRMVNQYKFAAALTDLSQESNDATYYDYFRTGKDGLYWDCINIVGLAESTVTVSNKSPLWRCSINGQPLSLQDIDAGYIADVADWVEDGGTNLEYAIEAHRKVEWLINA